MNWLVYYADGTIRSSQVFTWAELPVDGCVIALWWDSRGIRHLECGADTLVHTGDAIVSVNLPTLAFERAAQAEAGRGVLKYGVYMDPDAWTALRAVAGAQYKFPGA